MTSKLPTLPTVYDKLYGKSKVPQRFPTFVFKLAWRATSKVIKIQAKDYDAALKRAETEVKRTEGGGVCMGIHFIEERT